MSNRPELSILIVSYNTRALTLACLQSIYAETRKTPFQVIVLDNASADGSADEIEARFPDVRLIRVDSNLGFAKGNNLAAQSAEGTYLLLLNPDTLVLDGAIDGIVDFAKSTPQAGIWGGRTLFGDGTLNPSSCWQKLTLWNLFCSAAGLSTVFPNSSRLNSGAYGGWGRNTVRQVDIVTGCFFLIRREDWQRLGGFDERFFMYGEEVDFCLRAHKIGFRPLFTPDAKIIHYGGASETIRVNKLLRIWAAKALLVRTHFRRSQRGLALFLLLAWPATRAAGYSIASLFAPSLYKETSRTWQTVLRGSRTWLHGYPEG